MQQSHTFANPKSQHTSQSLQKCVPAQPHKHNNATDRKTTLVRGAACKSSYPKGGISCSKDTADVSGWLIMSSG